MGLFNLHVSRSRLITAPILSLFATRHPQLATVPEPFGNGADLVFTGHSPRFTRHRSGARLVTVRILSLLATGHTPLATYAHHSPKSRSRLVTVRLLSFLAPHHSPRNPAHRCGPCLLTGPPAPTEGLPFLACCEANLVVCFRCVREPDSARKKLAAKQFLHLHSPPFRSPFGNGADFVFARHTSHATRDLCLPLAKVPEPFVTVRILSLPATVPEPFDNGAPVNSSRHSPPSTRHYSGAHYGRQPHRHVG